MVKVKPIDDRLLVKPFTPAERTKGGLILTGEMVAKQQWGEVLAIGGKVNKDAEPEDVIKVGDHVVWSKHAGTCFTLDNQEFHLIKRSDVWSGIEGWSGESSAA